MRQVRRRPLGRAAARSSSVLCACTRVHTRAYMCVHGKRIGEYSGRDMTMYPSPPPWPRPESGEPKRQSADRPSGYCSDSDATARRAETGCRRRRYIPVMSRVTRHGAMSHRTDKREGRCLRSWEVWVVWALGAAMQGIHWLLVGRRRLPIYNSAILWSGATSSDGRFTRAPAAGP